VDEGAEVTSTREVGVAVVAVVDAESTSTREVGVAVDDVVADLVAVVVVVVDGTGQLLR
jgi:hypothetical protein